MYDTFLKVLAQIPCEAPSTQRYSLVRNCDDCAAAYKTWLCSVAIPRCEDFSSEEPWLQPRALSQPFPDGTFLDNATLARFPNAQSPAFANSRNPHIDEVVTPGPYKEVLPCDDVCHHLVQSCPAAMGFACPNPGAPGYDTSYRRKGPEDRNGSVTCSYPGSAHLFSGARGAAETSVTTLAALVGLTALLLT
jgi:calcium channel MID1